MRKNLIFFPNLDFDGRCRHIFPTEFHVSQGFGIHLLSQFSSLVDRSFYRSNHLYSSGSLALHGAFSYISKFAGPLFTRLSTWSNSNILHILSGKSCGSKHINCQSSTQTEDTCRQNLMVLTFGFLLKAEPAIPVLFAKLSNSIIRRLLKEIEQNQVFPMLSLAAAGVPPFDNLSSKVLSDLITLKSTEKWINGPMDQSLVENNSRGCSGVAVSKIIWQRDAIEPKTGIKFPTSLDRPLGGKDNSNLDTEVLVGIGSRSMRIIKVRSLKVYAFGLYVHPDLVCEKLGPKYASVPISELENCSNFFEDLLREDINMSVRLVVNCNGLKISTVRDAFEKSLRARLLKMNPNTDYRCLSAFRADFVQDIPIPVGTTIDFRQTADGQLITEIGGKRIGAVHNKDLCRAFFDMYIGDVPVSVQAKQEFAQNVAGIIRRC